MALAKSVLGELHGRRPNAVIFLSGSGSNAEKILQLRRRMLDAGKTVPFELRALVTDAPEKSRAIELGKIYGIPVISEDIREFYFSRGEKRVSIATEKGQQLRRKWTDCLRARLKPLEIDFAVFAGFVPLTNLAADFPCLNVHPGDLTYLKDGRRYLVGLHEIPVERAILEHLESMRSSVIWVQPYTGRGEDMDNGPLLGISGEVKIDLHGETVEHLAEIAAARPERRPVGGYKDLLEEIASKNLEELKIHGDWEVFPEVVCDFAAGKYGLSEDGTRLYYKIGTRFHPVETVEMAPGSREPVFAAGC